MRKIQGISLDPKQQFEILLDNGRTFTLSLEYKPLQLGWFCGVSYGSFQVQAVRVVYGYNSLAQFSNLIPFGLACFTQSGREPFFLEDFQSGNAALCVLDLAELADLEAYLGSKV